MKKDISKTEAKERIEEFFENLKDKESKDIKKIKRLAMAYNIKLGKKKKYFCKKCLNPYNDSSIRVKDRIIKITCGKCGNVSRWKIN